MKKLFLVLTISSFLAVLSYSSASASSSTCTVAVDCKYGVASSSARIIGSADSPNFSLFKLEYSPSTTSSWTQIGTDHVSPVTTGNALLETWDTSALPEGTYLVRLAIEHSDASTPDYSTSLLEIDHTMPKVVSSSPRWSATNVNPNFPVTISFSEKIDPDTIKSNTFYVARTGAGRVAGSISSGPDSKTVLFKPASRLRENTGYSIFISKAVSDRAGNGLAGDISFKIKTGDFTKPAIIFFKPRAGLKTNGKIIMTVRIKDNVALKNVRLYVDNKPIRIKRKVDKTYYVEWNSYGSRGGRHDFKVTAIDYFSNRATSRRAFIITPKIMAYFPKPSRFSPDGNKVNDVTKINFKLNSPSKVTVYILSGKKLIKMICRKKSFGFGMNSIIWDGKGVNKKRVHNGYYRFIIFAKNAGGSNRIIGKVEVKVGLKLEIDGPVSLLLKLSSRKLYLLSGKRIVSSYSIAVGKPGWRTPRGWFKVVAKQINPTWYPPHWSDIEGPVYPGPHNPLGPRRLLFTWDGYGIHGTNNPSSIGHAVSHGCVRMNNWAILEIFPVVPLGAPIHIVS